MELEHDQLRVTLFDDGKGTAYLEQLTPFGHVVRMERQEALHWLDQHIENLEKYKASFEFARCSISAAPLLAKK